MASNPTASQILSRFYAAETAYMSAPATSRDFSNTLGPTLSPNLVVRQSPDLPWGGEWIGHNGFQDWLETMSGYFSSLEVLDPRVFEQKGSDEVVVASTLRLKIKAGGQIREAPLMQIVKTDLEKGVLTEIIPFYWDVAGLKKELGM